MNAPASEAAAAKTRWATATRSRPGNHPANHVSREMISELPLSGQPGKAVGHAVGKLTLRHDLAPV